MAYTSTYIFCSTTGVYSGGEGKGVFAFPWNLVNQYNFGKNTLKLRNNKVNIICSSPRSGKK